METKLLLQIHLLQFCVLVLFLSTALLCVNCIHPLLSRQSLKVIEAERINIREKSGTFKAALSNSAGFNEGDRANQGEAPRLSGLMFYNEEGQETGGLVYLGKMTPGGQDSAVTLTMDQFRQDQNVYLHHVEHKDAQGLSIDDGLSSNTRPDWTNIKEEYRIYGEMEKLRVEQQDELKLKSLQAGRISTGRLFFGVKRGIKGSVPYDDAGVFIKNKWGRNAIKLYVDDNNEPHFEVYDSLGKSVVYELKVPRS
jgi:hypothetical protein